ncbi:dolichol kinase [Candidatus Bathyarchaeota archaeon]|nr:MAG: dolichol kinase [Candidatus Bathyarchaeota archaeon]
MSFISLEEIIATAILFSWIIFVVAFLTKKLYGVMMKRKFAHNVAVYYNRKVIHIFAGGLTAFLVPLIFKTPILPLSMALLLGVLTYVPHKTGKLMYWFQVKENMYEVSFCIMWGIIITLGWLVSGGEFWFGVLPVLFMSIGDAVTGIVRNMLYKRRTKSWWGNLTMALFSIPIGAILGFSGIIAGAFASFIEHFEFNPIDDNITVPAMSFLILLLTKVFAPWMLTF